jgi:hypothetical protein
MAVLQASSKYSHIIGYAPFFIGLLRLAPSLIRGVETASEF